MKYDNTVTFYSTCGSFQMSQWEAWWQSVVSTLTGANSYTSLSSFVKNIVILCNLTYSVWLFLFREADLQPFQDILYYYFLFIFHNTMIFRNEMYRKEWIAQPLAYVNMVLWACSATVSYCRLSHTEMNYVDIWLKTTVNRPAMQCNEESCTATEERSWSCTFEPLLTGM